MNEMVERVARALNPDAFRTDGGLPGEADRDMARRDARAAIEAMREPTPEMYVAASHESGYVTEEGWQAMIDAALQKVPA